MKEMVITSRKNPAALHARKIAENAKARKEEGLFFVEGPRLCCDAAKSGIDMPEVFVTEKAVSKYGSYFEEIYNSAQKAYVIDEHIVPMLSQTKNPQGVFALCCIPKPREELSAKKKIVLENIQDPSNLGAVMRTAEALGIDQIVLTGGICDVYSPKLLRASMGAVFRMDMFIEENTDSLFEMFNNAGISTYAAVADSSAKKLGDFEFSENCAVFIGNEGNGLTDNCIKKCQEKITIPMPGRAESLNAAAAAAIIMWNMK